MFHQLNIYSSLAISMPFCKGIAIQAGSTIINSKLVINKINVKGVIGIRKEETLFKQAKQYLSNIMHSNAYIAMHYP